MHRRILAFDFDGTLAENGVVPPQIYTALEQLYVSGYVLFLVTGRLTESVSLGALGDLFTGIVWENGAVLYDTANHETHLPFGQLDRHLVEALVAAGVPLEHGQAIVSTWAPHNKTVWRVINEWGGDAAVINNKGAVMILPAGAAKGSGLQRLLTICGFSPRNLVSFGDAENDLSLLNLGEYGVAVADAVPSLKAIADLVATQPGPAGVHEVLTGYWLNGRQLEVPLRREIQMLFGEDETNALVSLSGALLAGNNLGIFGDSGAGKSWVAGLLAEGMHHAGYQILLIDPEGDFRGMQVMSEFVAFNGSLRTMPTPSVVASVLETVGVSVVLDLSEYPVSKRGQYVANLLRLLRSLRERKFRPHWILLEEAQYFLSPSSDHYQSIMEQLEPMLTGGGWAFVSYSPAQLSNPLLSALNHCLLTRLSDADSIRVLHQQFLLPEDVPAGIQRQHVWVSGVGMVRLLPNARRVPHIRHLYKYLDTPLPKQKRFYFRDERGYLGLEAASLFEYLQLLSDLPVESLVYHQRRDDFAAWAEGALGDAELAAHLRKISHRQLTGETLRKALLQCVAAHYTEFHKRI
jgi:hydroxymethylpyrimidine pyrophosphatase-like HAD family hydrolase/archaellum biogenesis ATPase FlaH